MGGRRCRRWPGKPSTRQQGLESRPYYKRVGDPDRRAFTFRRRTPLSDRLDSTWRLPDNVNASIRAGPPRCLACRSNRSERSQELRRKFLGRAVTPAPLEGAIHRAAGAENVGERKRSSFSNVLGYLHVQVFNSPVSRHERRWASNLGTRADHCGARQSGPDRRGSDVRGRLDPFASRPESHSGAVDRHRRGHRAGRRDILSADDPARRDGPCDTYRAPGPAGLPEQQRHSVRHGLQHTPAAP